MRTGRRNLINVRSEAFKPPILKAHTTWLNRLENRLRQFVDLQTGSIWRDVRHALGSATGRLIDIGCGSQVYRHLVPATVQYTGIDTVHAKEQFGYEMPDTHYFEGDEW